MTTIYLKSAYAEASTTLNAAVARGDLVIINQQDLTADVLLRYQGLITGQQLDQDAFLRMKPALETFLDQGGRWFFNGHVVRPFLDGLQQYQALATPKRPDFALNAINPHPLFEGIDLIKLETNKGVAGFYGRGCNPMPGGAVAVNGFGAANVPVDWVWNRPRGGRIFSHAGNDLYTMGLEWGLAAELTERIINWTNGGACFDPWPLSPERPSDILPLAQADSYGGHRARTGSVHGRIIAPSGGTYYTIRSLEGPAYTDLFDVICQPEELGEILSPQDVLWVPCRTPAQRMIAQKDVLRRHLDAGGTIIALGESCSELWLPEIRFTETPTNWWWWREPGADLGVRISAPDHPLLSQMTDGDLTWHLHGWFDVPEGAQVLGRDGEGRAIFYIDDVSTPGRMIISSLDPMYHHGAHFMPATTRFLDRFIPNLKAYLS